MGKRKKIKTELLTIKVSPEEKREWKVMAKSYGLPLATMIRSRMETIPKPLISARQHRPPPKVDPELIRQIVRIGNSLSRIADRCDTDKRLEVLAELAAIERSVEELRSAYKVDERRER